MKIVSWESINLWIVYICNNVCKLLHKYLTIINVLAVLWSF